jgi:hypothetical protein
LRPLEALDDRRNDPLLIYVAIRKLNYWAEGFACIAKGPHPAASHAAALLDKVVSAIKPGMPLAQLAPTLAAASPYRHHPVTASAPVGAIGLALDAPPPTTLELGDVYSVRAGLTDGAGEHAIVSTMIVVRDGGCDILWRSGIA